MKFKVGDKVRIVSEYIVTEGLEEYLGKIMTIDTVYDSCYTVKEDNGKYIFYESMIEGLAEEEFVRGDIVIDESGIEGEFIVDLGEYDRDKNRYITKTDGRYCRTGSITKKEEKIEELTLEQVCKELGRTIKIIK